MSELAPNLPPLFPRPLPVDVANDRVNAIFRDAIREAIAAERAHDAPADADFGEEVARHFYDILGAGAIAAEIEVILQELPSRYLGEVTRDETALRMVDRVDFRAYSHTAILSPIIGIMGHDGGPYYVGTDKFGHFVQQGYDYLTIYRNVEDERPDRPPELFAYAWGLWSEGIELTDEYVRNYLETHGLAAEPETVSELKDELVEFMEEADIIEYMSPTPEFAKGSDVLRWTADAIGTHQFGILGSASSGIISYADLYANEAGLRFFFELIEDPEAMAENFDVADYVTPQWDEEILPPTYVPIVTERIEEAQGLDIKWPIIYGFGFELSGPPARLAASMPVIYHPWRDAEWRLRLGASMPLTGDETRLEYESMGFASLDMSMRITGLHFAYLTFTSGFTKDGFHPIIGAGYEVMFLGWMSIYLGFNFDINGYEPSFCLGTVGILR